MITKISMYQGKLYTFRGRSQDYHTACRIRCHQRTNSGFHNYNTARIEGSGASEAYKLSAVDQLVVGT